MEDGENVGMALTDHKCGITRTQIVRNSASPTAQDCDREEFLGNKAQKDILWTLKTTKMYGISHNSRWV